MSQNRRKENSVLTTTQAAKMLGVATSTVQVWMENGYIHSWKTPGGHRRTRESDVRDLVEKLSGPSGRKVSRESLKPVDSEYLTDETLAFPRSAQEAARLAAVAASNLIDTLSHERFDRIVRLASQATRSPIALISLLTSKRQWFKARIGLRIQQMPVGWSFCKYAIEQGSPLIVEDAMSDERFSDNPLVLAEPRIRFYAGVPLRDKCGIPIGALCVMDREPRKLRASELNALVDLAAIVNSEIGTDGTGA